MSSSGARNYGIVTAAYWGFTLTDGALRMLVLLHFYRLGYSPFTLAFLFLLYEAAGVLANLIGGWLAARFGITRMLSVGLATQIIGFLLLSMLSPDWAAGLSVAWVVLAQGVCGVAKDLTKTASKSAIKITAGEASGQLFKWVAWFTGSKNAMKGVGFFLGGLLLDLLGFRGALWAMAALLAVVLVAVLASLPPMMGKSGLSTEVPAARLWSGLLALVPIALALAVTFSVPQLTWVVVIGLGVFGFAFAVNSSVHSYLILAYAGSEKAAEDVGFYYAANAMGRLIGTLLSGVLYQWGGLLAALIGSAVMLVLCWLVTLFLPTTRA
jgi:predicted MFS family arabinose efflux permease